MYKLMTLVVFLMACGGFEVPPGNWTSVGFGPPQQKFVPADNGPYGHPVPGGAQVLDCIAPDVKPVVWTCGMQGALPDAPRPGRRYVGEWVNEYWIDGMQQFILPPGTPPLVKADWTIHRIQYTQHNGQTTRDYRPLLTF